MIAEGQFAEIESDTLRRELSAWRSSSIDQRVQVRTNTRNQLIVARNHAATLFPLAYLVDSWWKRPFEENFPIDLARVLGDPTLEGHIALLDNYRRSTCWLDRNRRAQIERLLANIDAYVSA